ncbi:DUF58 domain-containing protein [Chengkuizengella marina]|uniref:DUF58 domain-containing protein n=1 Tax=Chengkuizengella marina TaxID=2507566 RepID=A0A6N9PWL0_9BACL|nr:DUF58 domain-containing protein [Chengkuizengella marina]NBI27901.1 DUF58 domain-containing protein [Chengkuizengella marina]
MMWEKEVHIPEIFKHLGYILPIVFVLTYFLVSSPFFLYSMFFIFVIYGINYYNLQTIHNKIRLIDKKKTIRLFPNEMATIPVVIKHKGIIPLTQGHISFQCSDTIKCLNTSSSIEGNNRSIYKFPISYQYKSMKSYSIEILAKKRGTANLQNLELKAIDPFYISYSSLLYKYKFRTEVIVFPEPKQIANVNMLTKMKGGDYVTHHSLFEDTSLIRGAREYTVNDPFSRVHWGLSAKNNTLMTKEFDKTTYVKWTIILNVLLDHPSSWSFSSKFEDYISYATYMCQYAHKFDIPFEMYSNVVMNYNQSQFHIETGKGKTHLLKSMEMLSRISPGGFSINLLPFYTSLKRKLDQDGIIIYIGNQGDKTVNFLSSQNQSGTTIFTVDVTDDSANLKPFTMSARRGSFA